MFSRHKLISVLPLSLSLLFCSCFLHAASQYEQRYHSSSQLDEIRTELAEVKHNLNSHEVDLRILEEKLQSQGSSLHSLQSQNKQPSKVSDNKDQLASMERRIASIEKMQEKIATDLRSISSHATQISTALNQYKEKIHECEMLIASHSQKFEEVAKLKGTLTSISKAMKQPTPEASSKSYKVKAGDSLEKIARLHQCSVEKIKQVNQLENDKIVVGQEIKVPNDQ